MKRGLLVSLFLFACQQSVVSPTAGISGVRDMVLVGNFMFVTSSERDELRVLSLSTGDTTNPRRYVRAPNPIQALAIPVLKRPTRLVADEQFIGGVLQSGPYVYASSPGLSEISVVWGQNPASDQTRSLTELARIVTVAPVTATAAVGPPTAGANSSLFFATFDGDQTTVFGVSLLPPPAINPNVQADVKVIATRQGESIVDMIAVPPNRLAFTTRTASGKGGSAVIVDLATGASLPLQFPSPVRSLYTLGAFSVGGTSVAAGARIFGVIDEDQCGGVACGALISVDSDTGLRSLSQPGRELLARDPSLPRDFGVAPPLQFGTGLIQSVSLNPGGQIALPPPLTPSGNYEELATNALGVVTLSNGQIGFFLAAELQQINITSAGPTFELTGPDGGFTTDGGEFGVGVALAFGAVRDEVLFTVGNAVIQDLGALTPMGTFLPTGVPSRAQVGDLVEGCTGTTITAIEPAGLRMSAPCAASSVAVRAAGSQPYVVVGSTNGYMGRSGPGQTFTFAEGYFAHSSEIFPGVPFDPREPAIRITFPTDLVLGLEDRFTFSIDDGYLPTVMTLVTTACNSGTTTLPGTVIDWSGNGDGNQAIFVAYPSANGIVEIVPKYVVRTAALDTGLFCWR